jgi:SAM-dependent methyltransferase
VSDPSRRRPSDRQAVADQVAVLGVAEGFFDSSVVIALADVGAFAAIGDGARTAGELAAELGVHEGALRRLLAAGVAVKALASDDGRTFRLSPLFGRVLAGGAPLGNWIRNLGYFRDVLTGLAEAVRTGEPHTTLADDVVSGGRARDLTLAMDDYASLRGAEVAHRLDLSGCRTLLDVGCGPGTYAFLLAEANPELHVTLLDLEPVLEVAAEVAERYDVDPARIAYRPGDIRHDEVGGPYDVVLVSNVLHVFGEDGGRRLLARLHDAVAPGGSLVVQAQFIRPDGLGPRWSLLVDLVQLCITPGGRNHTVPETIRWLEETGFVDVEHEPMSMLNTNSYVRGWRPGGGRPG